MRTEYEKWFEQDNTCTWETNDPAEIHKDLMNDLIAKKLHKCTYIRSIKDRPNYDGTRTITVYHDNGCKRVYVVETK